MKLQRFLPTLFLALLGLFVSSPRAHADDVDVHITAAARKLRCTLDADAALEFRAAFDAAIAARIDVGASSQLLLRVAAAYRRAELWIEAAAALEAYAALSPVPFDARFRLAEAVQLRAFAAGNLGIKLEGDLDADGLIDGDLNFDGRVDVAADASLPRVRIDGRFGMDFDRDGSLEAFLGVPIARIAAKLGTDVDLLLVAALGGSLPRANADGSLRANADGSLRANVDGSLPRANVDGSLPNVDGRLPNVDGSLPNVGGRLPNVDGSLPNVDGNLPNVDPNLRRPNVDLDARAKLRTRRLLWGLGAGVGGLAFVGGITGLSLGLRAKNINADLPPIGSPGFDAQLALHGRLVKSMKWVLGVGGVVAVGAITGVIIVAIRARHRARAGAGVNLDLDCDTAWHLTPGPGLAGIGVERRFF